MKRLLILRLEGLLQSWDDSSKWDDRDTGSFPSKSGVIGLLGCALGLERGSHELVDLDCAITMAVRADRSGVKTVDFQTVTGNPLRNAEGKKRSPGGDTIISRRSYLQDACFTVFLEMEGFWHERIVKALNAPKWCLFLGRKSCVPSRPVLECCEPGYSDITEAMRLYPLAARSSYPVPFETEIQDDLLSSVTRADVISDVDRQFGRRRVWRGLIEEGDCVSFES